MDEKASAASAPEVLENLVRLAERAGASDIHLQMRGKSAEVGFRLDGIITPGRELPAEIAERVFGRIKFLARLKTYQESLPQDGRISRDELKCQKRHPRRDLSDRHRRKNRPAAVQFNFGQNPGRN